MSDERGRETRDAEPEEEPAEQVEVNPAARRDGTDTPLEEAEEHRPGDREVPPTQGEPLDPLGPGGIGS